MCGDGKESIRTAEEKKEPRSAEELYAEARKLLEKKNKLVEVSK